MYCVTIYYRGLLSTERVIDDRSLIPFLSFVSFFIHSRSKFITDLRSKINPESV